MAGYYVLKDGGVYYAYFTDQPISGLNVTSGGHTYSVLVEDSREVRHHPNGGFWGYVTGRRPPEKTQWRSLIGLSKYPDEVICAILKLSRDFKIRRRNYKVDLVRA